MYETAQRGAPYTLKAPQGWTSRAQPYEVLINQVITYIVSLTKVYLSSRNIIL